MMRTGRSDGPSSTPSTRRRPSRERIRRIMQQLIQDGVESVGHAEIIVVTRMSEG